MILKKRNITLVTISIIIIVLVVLIALGILYLKTDIFKSKETLFAKYFIQNFDIIEILKNEDTLGIERTLNENKYVSELDGKIEYTENIGTSAENKNNSINNIVIGVKSNIDKINNYEYRDVNIKNSTEDIVKFEYLNQNQKYGIRLNGIQQFISVDTETDGEILENIGLENIEKIASEIDIDSILNFSEEEKQTLINTYINIVQNKISKDKYYKQSNELITINDKEIKVNAYGIRLTVEQYNDIIIDILTQISQDEMILSRIDFIENEIKDRYTDYNQDESLKNKFVNVISNKVKEIKDNNIGNDEVKIIVYESNKKTVRTLIEKVTEKVMIDLQDLSVNIDKIASKDIQKETLLKIQKNVPNKMYVEYSVIQNSETINEIKYSCEESLNEKQIDKKVEIEIANQKNKIIFDIVDNIKIVEEFFDEITLDTNNIYLNSLEETQLDVVMKIVNENIENQLNNLKSVISMEDCFEILQNLGYIDSTISIELPDEGEVSTIEKKRFNSQFEFFVSENLTTDNVKELMKVCENNFEDMKVLLKSGEIQDLDIEKLNDFQNSKEYINNISEILIFVKRNTTNEQKKNDVIKFLENDTDNKYNVFIQYDENGLVKLMRIQLQSDE